VSNPALDEVTVWATWSLLVTVTVAPGDTVMEPGENEKFLMVMAPALAGVEFEDPAAAAAVVEVLDGVAVLLEEQAARVRATPNTATTAKFLVCAHPFRVERWLVV
jgi:hypothetical protein